MKKREPRNHQTPNETPLFPWCRELGVWDWGFEIGGLRLGVWDWGFIRIFSFFDFFRFFLFCSFWEGESPGGMNLSHYSASAASAAALLLVSYRSSRTMNNDDFRRLVSEKKKNLNSAGAAGAAGSAGSHRSRRQHAHGRNQGSHGKGPNDEDDEDPLAYEKGRLLELKDIYRDRAQERRDGVNADYEGDVKPENMEKLTHDETKYL